MRQSKSMAEFVRRLLLGAHVQEFVIRRQAVKLLPQTVRGHQGGASANLRLTKNKSKNRNEKIQISNAQDLCALARSDLSEQRQDLCRMVLPPRRAERRPHTQVSPFFNARRTEATRQCQHKVFEKSVIQVTKRDDFDLGKRLHRFTRLAGCQFARTICDRRRPFETVFLDPVIECHSIDL